MKEDKKIIEVGGIKLEVDMRYAKVIEHYQIGQKVKVLIKKYSDTYESHPGIIVGFDNFKTLPTIVIAHTKQEYNGADIEILYLNSASKDVEICPMIDDDLKLNHDATVNAFDRGIAKKRQELEDLEMKKAYFIERFGQIITLKEKEA